MINRETIEKINKELSLGDKAEIERITGFSHPTVMRFFNGRENELSEDKCLKIQDVANNIISERQKRRKAIAKKTNSLLK